MVAKKRFGFVLWWTTASEQQFEKFGAARRHLRWILVQYDRCAGRRVHGLKLQKKAGRRAFQSCCATTQE
jgi:hypothetical protein